MSNSYTTNIEESGLVDLTTNLPDEILHQILSYVPYGSLIHVKFLCKRIHAFWSTISRSSGSINGLEGAIASFLDGITASDPFRHPWRLAYTYRNSSTLRATVTCDWQLRLDFFKPEKTMGLFHLSLDIPGRNGDDADLDMMSFYVKSLHLASVSSHLTSNVISSVVSRFGFLQCLRLEGCRMSSLYVSAPELRELTILDCFLLRSVRVVAPKLEVFRFRGARPWFLAKGLDKTKLVDAMLDFRSGSHSRFLGSKLNLLLLLMKDVESLTLCRATYEEIIASEQYKGCEKIKLERLKELWWIDNSVDSQRTNVLLSFLRICPMLEKLFITIDPKSSWSRSMVKRFDRPIKRTGLSRLEFVKMEGCVDEDAETLLAEAVADSATMNAFIVSRTNDGSYRKYVKVNLDQSMRIGVPEFECTKTKHAFKPVKLDDERMVSELNHVHMII